VSATQGIIQKVTDAIRKHQLIRQGDHLLIGVSGGADSVMMMHLLDDLSSPCDFLLTVAHLNHGIRTEADDDATFVQSIAAARGIPFVLDQIDVPALAEANGESIEMAARRARYAFFADAARNAECTVIATAHTRDDQAETIVLNLARGTGVGALAGIPRCSALGPTRLIRPLLDVTRHDVETYLREHSIPWREDASNTDTRFLRNRVRHHVMPMLESQLNPQIRDALLRCADIWGEEDRWLEALTKEALDSCRAEDDLLLKPLRDLPTAARRRVLRRWLDQAGVDPAARSYDAIQRTESLLSSDHGSSSIPLRGDTCVVREYDRLRLEIPSANGDPCEDAIPVRVPGVTTHPGLDLDIEASIAPGIVRESSATPGALPSRASIAIRADAIDTLFVRTWQPGDTMRLRGVSGAKKLQDIFTDAKVPSRQRNRIPVIECGGEIAWIPGFRVAEGWEVRGAGDDAIQLCCRTPRR